MTYNYNQAISNYKNNYQLAKAIKNKEIFKIEPGLYSNEEYNNKLLVISKKYPNAIFTSDSAYYYQNLTDVIPQNYYLATHRKASKINDKNIKQIYMSEDKYELGIEIIKVNGVDIKTYDKEKLLIELVKNCDKIPLDYYKEIVSNYRTISDNLDLDKISCYLNYYKNENNLFKKIQIEVF